MDMRDRIADILAEILFQGQRDGMELGMDDTPNSKATNLTPYIDAILALEHPTKKILGGCGRPDICNDRPIKCIDCEHNILPRPATIGDLIGGHGT